jgi:hypothetical protein
MDQARMAFIERLLHHITALREELRNNEVILHSVIKSLSNKTDEMQQLDFNLHVQEKEGNLHKPMILTEEERRRLAHVQSALSRELAEAQQLLNSDQHNRE